MSTETSFNIQWLKERFAFDCQARNQEVEQACLQLLNSKKEINILDLGAGSGSSFLYLSEKIPQSQHWTFVELNGELAAAALERIAENAGQQNLKIERPDKKLSLKRGNKVITIEVIQGSFLELEELVDLRKYDLATAAAVLDLLTRPMLEDLLKKLAYVQVPLLATINYAGMAFDPVDPADKKYVDLYGMHMQREQAFGQTLGPDCTDAMLRFCDARNQKAMSGKSNWLVNPEATTMHRFLLEYMSSAIPEMLADEPGGALFNKWLKEKQVLVEQQRLSTRVFHFDVLVLP